MWQYVLLLLYVCRRAKRLGRSVSEQHNIEDMIASIRLRVTHHDAYEEWEQQTRKDAFVSSQIPLRVPVAYQV